MASHSSAVSIRRLPAGTAVCRSAAISQTATSDARPKRSERRNRATVPRRATIAIEASQRAATSGRRIDPSSMRAKRRIACRATIHRAPAAKRMRRSPARRVISRKVYGLSDEGRTAERAVEDAHRLSVTRRAGVQPHFRTADRRGALPNILFEPPSSLDSGTVTTPEYGGGRSLPPPRTFLLRCDRREMLRGVVGDTHKRPWSQAGRDRCDFQTEIPLGAHRWKHIEQL